MIHTLETDPGKERDMQGKKIKEIKTNTMGKTHSGLYSKGGTVFGFEKRRTSRGKTHVHRV